MPVIYDDQYDRHYNPPKFGTGLRKKKTAFTTLYTGYAFRNFGNNVVIGSAIPRKQDKLEFLAEKKAKQLKQEKQTNVLGVVACKI